MGGKKKNPFGGLSAGTVFSKNKRGLLGRFFFGSGNGKKKIPFFSVRGGKNTKLNGGREHKKTQKPSSRFIAFGSKRGGPLLWERAGSFFFPAEHSVVFSIKKKKKKQKKKLFPKGRNFLSFFSFSGPLLAKILRSHYFSEKNRGSPPPNPGRQFWGKKKNKKNVAGGVGAGEKNSSMFNGLSEKNFVPGSPRKTRSFWGLGNLSCYKGRGGGPKPKFPRKNRPASLGPPGPLFGPQLFINKKQRFRQWAFFKAFRALSRLFSKGTKGKKGKKKKNKTKNKTVWGTKEKCWPAMVKQRTIKKQRVLFPGDNRKGGPKKKKPDAQKKTKKVHTWATKHKIRGPTKTKKNFFSAPKNHLWPGLVKPKFFFFVQKNKSLFPGQKGPKKKTKNQAKQKTAKGGKKKKQKKHKPTTTTKRDTTIEATPAKRGKEKKKKKKKKQNVFRRSFSRAHRAMFAQAGNPGQNVPKGPRQNITRKKKAEPKKKKKKTAKTTKKKKYLCRSREAGEAHNPTHPPPPQPPTKNDDQRWRPYKLDLSSPCSRTVRSGMKARGGPQEN